MDRNTEIHPQQQYQQQVYRPVTMPYFSGQLVGDTFEVPSDLVIENKNVQHYQQYHQNPNQQIYYTREVHYPPSEPTHQYSYSRQEFTHGGQVPTQQTQFSTSGKQFPGHIDIPVSRTQQQPTRPAYPDLQNKSAILDEIQAIESGHADESVYRQEIPIGNFNKLSVSETQPPTAQTEHWVHEQTNAQRQIQQSSSPSRQLYQSYPDSYQQYGGGDYPYEQDRFETNFSTQHGNRPEDVAQAPYEQYQYRPYQQHVQGQHFQHITTEDTGWGKSGPYDGAIPSGPPPVFTTGPQVSPPVTYRTAAQMRRAESEKARRHHSPVEGASERGYLFGGMDFIDHSDQPVSTNPQDYELSGSEHRSRRATTGSPGPPRRPGDYYGLDYTVFIPGEQPPPAGDEASYKGYKAQKPRKHWHFSADPQATMLNNFEVEVVEGVDPVRLVGDTLSNQKVPVERELTEEEKNNFCTTYAPPSGFKPDHRTVRPEPKSPEPICFSLSVNKQLATDTSSTPGSQQQTCLPNRGPHAPLSGHNSSWYATGNKEIMRNEPNWARNVHQRRYAWENNTRSADSRLYLPSWAKVPPQQPPPWANRANTTHNKWQTAADRGYIGSGNYNTGYNYTVNDSTGGEQQEPQEVPTKTIYYNQPLPQHQKTQAVRNQQNQQQEQTLAADHLNGQQTKQPDEIEVQVEPQEESQQPSHLSIKQHQQQQTIFAPKQAHSTQKNDQAQIRPQQQQQKFVQQQQAPSRNLQQQTQINQQKYQQQFQQPSDQQWQQHTGAVTQTTYHHQELQQQQHPQIIYEQSQTNRYPQQSAAPQSKSQHYGQAQLQPQSPTKQQVQNVQINAQSQNRVGRQPAQPGHYFRNQLNQPLSNTRPGTIKSAGATSAGNAPESKGVTHQESNPQPHESQRQVIRPYDDYDINVKGETNYGGQPHGGDRQPNLIQYQQQDTRHGQPNQSQHPHQPQQYYSSVQQQYYSPQPQRRALPQPTQHQNIATTRQQQRESWFTGQPAPIGHQPANNVQQQSQQNPQYQIRAEMSENLPPGQLSYSYTNTSGNFPDKGHGYVNYSREVSTATNPGGQEWQLLKQQESRVLDEPIAEEPGMMASF